MPTTLYKHTLIDFSGFIHGCFDENVTSHADALRKQWSLNWNSMNYWKLQINLKTANQFHVVND